MKVVLSEKQLKLILSKEVDIDEQDATSEPAAGTDPSSAQPKTGTSDTGNKQGYPEVGKWESGVTRGPANQIGVTKWSDVVGSSLKRDKGNQLKEQIIGTTSMNYEETPEEIVKRKQEEEKEKKFEQNYMIVKVPENDYTKNTLILPKEVGGFKTSYTVFKHPINPNIFFNSWVGTAWENYIPSEYVLNNIIPNGSVRSFIVAGVKYNSSLKRVSDDPITWKFNWYSDDDGVSYDQFFYIRKEDIPKNAYAKEKTWWDVWGQWLLAGGSILASMLIPGAAGIWIAVGLDLVAAGDVLLREKDALGAGMYALLAFVPVIGNTLKWGKISEESVSKLAKEFAPLRTQDEIMKKINSLPPKEKYIIQKLLKEDPRRIEEIIWNTLHQKVTTRQQALRVVSTINDAMKNGKIPKKTGYQWYKRLGVKRFGYEMAANGLIIGGGMGLKIYLSKRDQERLLKNMQPSKEGIEMGNLYIKISNEHPDDYKNIFVPIIEKYSDLYGESNEKKFYEIQKIVANEYFKNPKQDFNKIADNADKNLN